jgi:hypothetical protein
MSRTTILHGLAIAATVAAAACNSSTAPSGPCASDEQAASLLYGPPLSVKTSGDTTTYTYGGSKLFFIVEGASCIERSGA